MTCLILFPEENKKQIILSSAELAQKVVKVKYDGRAKGSVTNRLP